MFLNDYWLIPTQFLLTLLASAFKFYLTSPNVKTFCPPQNSITLSNSDSNGNYRQDLINPNTLLLTVPILYKSPFLENEENLKSEFVKKIFF